MGTSIQRRQRAIFSWQEYPPQQIVPLRFKELKMGEDEVEYDDKKDLLNRKLILMGNNVGEIPCFRNSFLYGITSGMVAGIAFFAFTSKIRRATSVGFWSYIGVTSVYWLQCRYRFSAIKFEYEQLSYAMQQQAKYEGTSQGLNVQKMDEETKTVSTPTKNDTRTSSNFGVTG